MIDYDQTKHMVEFGEKVVALIKEYPERTPGLGGVLIGLGVGVKVAQGCTDAAIYKTTDAAIRSARSTGGT